MTRRGVWLTEDYLIRMINLALAALARIVGLRTASMYLEAQTAIDEMLEEVFGLRADLIKRLDDQNLLDSLTVQGRLDTDRLWIVAALYKEEGDVYAVWDNPENSRVSYLRALNFFLEVVLQGGATHLPHPGDQIQTLLESLGDQDLPPETMYSIFLYEDQMGQFARAIYWLEKLSSLPVGLEAMQDESRDYYHRLLEKSENELAAGGLERSKVQKRLDEVS